jgi:3-hydroxybutyryl-CoA dehydrogenase
MIQSICVCGAGTMGNGIAQTAAQSGFYTILYDLDPVMLEKATVFAEESLQSLVEKNRISQPEKKGILNRLHFTSSRKDCVADFIIEAIVEKSEAKVDLFNQLAELNRDETIFVSNTSSLSVTAIAEKVKQPQRVAGMHFFNPAPVMKLVEVVRTKFTSETTIRAITELAKQMGKTPVLCEDAPGFIVNHVARPYYLEALHLIEKGIGDVETIDSVMEASGFKMGPFRLMDLIGNDINYSVSCSLYEAMGRPERLRPSLLQKDKVEKKEWGRKTGKGYYKYEP